uniref:F-box-like family protein n=1 Tax=Pithovirus LCPAC401 TaxID=2506595 RepID=A0A481ZA49_9VIRU|nr:MAG: F-box-like family protein [Pithovirus LCPAC401]
MILLKLININISCKNVKMDSVSSDVLQTILSYLDIGEISRKCFTSHPFDRVCKSEFLLKNILEKDYSVIEKGDNDTWRNKAKKVYLESALF